MAVQNDRRKELSSRITLLGDHSCLIKSSVRHPLRYASTSDLGPENGESETIVTTQDFSDRHCRILLRNLIEDSEHEVLDACNRTFDPAKAIELTTWTYYDTDMHRVTVEGYTTRSIIETCVDDSKRSIILGTQAILLIEIATDLITRQFRWSAAELGMLHATDQGRWSEMMKDEIRLISIAWRRIHQPVKDGSIFGAAGWA